MPLKGIDVSGWQPTIDPGATAADFVIVKATEGDNYLNPKMHNQCARTQQSGKLLGLYHFATGSPSAVAEADFFVSAAKPYLGKAVLVLDWEADVLQKGPSYAEVFLDRVRQKTGYIPWIYMSKGVTRQYNWTRVAKTYPLWFAQYANYNPTGWQTDPWTDSWGTGAWAKAIAFQYTSSGRIPGYSGKLDLNIFYGGRSDWINMASGKGGIVTGSVAKFIERMVYWCVKVSLGYDQRNRWDIRVGGECDCSSLVYWCLWEAGLLTKPSGNLYNHTLYTGTLRRDLTNAGWKALSPDLSLCRPGDILLNDGNHVAVVVSGSGTTAKLAQASIDENGNIAGGQSGDQTGQETTVRTVYDYPWNVILRPPANSEKPKGDDVKLVTNTGGDVRRLYNPKSGRHILTIDKAEANALKKGGWKDEGVSFKAPKGGTVAVYRMYDPKTGDHLFTTSFKEAQTVQKSGWEYEGVPWFGKDMGSDVYRLYKDDKHLFTPDKNEHDTLKKKGWKSEGVAWKF